MRLKGAFFFFQSESLFPHRHPDILHLRGLMQELMAFALLAIHPIARQAVVIPFD